MQFVKEIVRLDEPQSTAVADLLTQRIIQSKRLLADHIEFLEQCRVIPTKCSKTSIVRNYTISLVGGVIISSLAIATFKAKFNCMRLLAQIAATTYNICFTVKTFSIIRHELTQRRLNETIASIDRADAAIRKNISFFRELKFLAGSSSLYSSHGRRELSLKSIAEIIRIFYAEVKRLELISIPEHIEAMYEPLEELSTCIYFQKNINEFSSDDIKAFYNIFLYFQSQYLMRLCMILLYAQEDSLKYLNDANIQFQKNLSIHIEKLSVWLNEIVRPTTVQSNQSIQDTLNLNLNRSEDIDLLKIKRSSMDILCRLIAATNQFQSTEQNIQCTDCNSLNKSKMLELLDEMKRTKESLDACQDDFKTLQMIYYKYLVQKFEIPIEIAKNVDDDSKEKINLAEGADENVEMNVEEENKEYFGMRDTKHDDDLDSSDESADEKISRNDWQNELDNIDMKVTRSFFAPVLKQLKTKIDPIKTEMKEREMKFLMSKGIDREKIIEFDKNEEAQAQLSNSSDTDSSDSADIQKRRRKTKPRPDRYNEMRSFLEQKQPIRFMPLTNLPPPSGSEDVLE